LSQLGHGGISHFNCVAVAAVFPITTVQATDAKQPPHEFHSAADQAVYELYEPEHYLNEPISLQAVGQKNEEEATIRMTEIIVEALRAG